MPRPSKRSWWGGKLKAKAPGLSYDEQLEILRVAGRWYVFWGSRDHPIMAWYRSRALFSPAPGSSTRLHLVRARLM